MVAGGRYELYSNYPLEKLPVTSNPNSWTIRRIEDGDLDGRAVKIVYLSCCYLGDVAYFDKTNSVLLKYDPGPK